MGHQKTVTVLGACIAILAAIAALTGILSSGGPGVYEYESIRKDSCYGIARAERDAGCGNHSYNHIRVNYLHSVNF